MTRCNPGGNISRTTHQNSNKRPTIRSNSIYCLRNLILHIILPYKITPTTELGSTWPPTGIQPLNPIQVPLLKTAILLASGVTVTWAHHGLLENNAMQATQGLFFTLLLGLYFTALQEYRYFEAPFTIADSAYGSTFFVATGFHGLHVIIGKTFLTTCLLRHISLHFSSHHHFGFEAAAWYWHFVDVVWLFLYISIYW